MLSTGLSYMSMNHFTGLEFNSVHLCLLGHFVYGCICVSASVAISCSSTAKVAGPLILVISCPDRIAADTVFAPARGQRLCVCLRACVCAQALFPPSHFSLPMCVRVLRCEANCEMIANAESGGRERERGRWRRGNQCGAILKKKLRRNRRARKHKRPCVHSCTHETHCYLFQPAVLPGCTRHLLYISVCFWFACVLDEHRCPLVNFPSLHLYFAQV